RQHTDARRSNAGSPAQLLRGERIISLWTRPGLDAPETGTTHAPAASTGFGFWTVTAATRGCEEDIDRSFCPRVARRGRGKKDGQIVQSRCQGFRSAGSGSRGKESQTDGERQGLSRQSRIAEVILAVDSKRVKR